MSKHFQVVISIVAALALAFMFVACGGSSSGGGDVTYSGSTDPAVADSTTAPTLAEYGIGVLEAGFPLAGPFATPPPGIILTSLSAKPLVVYAETTTVTIPFPPEAVYDGADYDDVGTGSLDLNGDLTLYLGTYSAGADTWEIAYAEMDGSIVFNNFRVDDGPAVTGRVTVPFAQFQFSGEALFEMSSMSIPDDPGFPIWQLLQMTFTNITVSDGGESWSLGEGDWEMEVLFDSYVSLDINSMTVEYQGDTYKLEDTNLYVESGEVVPLAVGSWTDYTISGVDADNGTFYHPELGVIYFSGDLNEEDPPGDITGGELNFYDAANEGNSQFFIYFGYDEAYNDGEGATVYELNMDTEEYYEIGYFIDGTFIEDPSAPSLG
jgi:hypothetical protein